MKKYIVVIGLLSALLILMSFGASTAFADEPSGEACKNVEQVLDRYIEALGGQEALSKLTSRVCLGQIIHNLPWQNPTMQIAFFEAQAVAPFFYLMEETADGGTTRSGFDGEVQWSQDTTGAVHENAGWLFGSTLAFLLNPQNALYIEDYFPELTLRSSDNDTVCVLVPANMEEAHHALYFDAWTGLLVRVGHYWDLRNYREVDGVLFPHLVAQSRKGGSTSYMFDEVRHNEEVNKSKLQMPLE